MSGFAVEHSQAVDVDGSVLGGNHDCQLLKEV
jgi:hypothetical protein